MRVCLLLLAATLVNAQSFTFGVVADIQYADQENNGVRHYRESLGKLEQCVAAWNRERPAFVVQLGDFVDGGGMPTVQRVLSVWNTIAAPKYHVLGNHDSFREMSPKYYDFTSNGYRFIVLNGMEVNSESAEGAAILAKLKEAKAPNAQPWDGALGSRQREWMRGVLADAAKHGQRAILFCHHPTVAKSCRPAHLLWDHNEVEAILKASPAVAAYIAGHDHVGGFAEVDGIPYITIPGLVEHTVQQGCHFVDVSRDKLVVRTIGGDRREIALRR